MGVLANKGVLFAGYAWPTPDPDDSTAVVDDGTPTLGTTVTVTITGLDGMDPCKNRGVFVEADDATGLTIPAAARTDVAGESVVVIAIAADADETLRTLTISCGGVELTDTPTFTPTAP